MKINYKILGLVMFVMLVCCVSAASAADVDNITVPDDTSVIEIDEAVDSVEDIESDEISDYTDDSLEEVGSDEISDDVNVDSNKSMINQGNLRSPAKINGNTNIYNYFTTAGILKNNVGNTFTFSGDFYKTSYSFTNFKINRAVTINAVGATFHDMGFELSNSAITLNGATFIMNAPEDEDCILINVNNAANSVISNNVITYTCNYENDANYNHVIRVVGGNNVSVSGNNITAYLPLKNVDFNKPYPSIYTDLVAGVAVQSSNNFRFTNNRLLVNVSKIITGYPTLDAFIIAGSTNAYIAGNTIIEIDNLTRNSNNYLYAIDVYQCDDITIDNNIIRLESQGGSIIPGTNNGTSAAYGIQLTGGHTGVTISNNNIRTSNNGPNCGIYSQNFIDRTELTITDNTIYVEGNAGLHSWSLVTGMELGDDYVYVSGNNITVKNKVAYTEGANAYGISYSQWTPGDHEQYIYSNNVTVINGKYAVYMSSSSSVSEAAYNNLTTDYYTGNPAVYPNGDIYIHDNH